MKISWDEMIMLAASCLLLIALAWQYPASTTFPIGGDAATYITHVRTILNHPTQTFNILRGSWYPTMYAILSPAALIPFIDWPARFTLYMALGQIATGLAIGWLCYRLNGVKSAAFGIALWALTPVILTPFYEDGTLAQLWSLPFFILFFERLLANSPWGILITLMLVTTTHPISGVVLLITIAIASPSLWRIRTHLFAPEKKFINIILIISSSIFVLFCGLLIFHYKTFTIAYPPEHSSYTQELYHGFFASWVALAVIGYLAMVNKLKSKPQNLILIGSLIFATLLLAFNDYAGVGFWTRRLTPYLVIVTIAGAAYILPKLCNQVLVKNWLTVTVFIVLFASLGISVWNENAPRYRFYEAPGNYGRLLLGEEASILWLKNNVPPNSHIYSTIANRNTEWIPALTLLTWIPFEPDPVQQIKNHQDQAHSYVVYFKQREKVPPQYLNDPSHYKIIYQNNSAIILQPL